MQQKMHGINLPISLEIEAQKSFEKYVKIRKEGHFLLTGLSVKGGVVCKNKKER